MKAWKPLGMGFAGLLLAAGAALFDMPASAESGGGDKPASAQDLRTGPSGLPLPRFVSLKSGRVNMRVGPGLNYGVNWLYQKEGLPVEIVQEYDTWRRVRDVDGAEGWINQALLSGKRTAIAAPWFKGKEAQIFLHNAPAKDSSAIVQVEAGAVGSIENCNGNWCEMRFRGTTGWIDQSLVWGAYPGETVKD